jgi:hypothetical protein
VHAEGVDRALDIGECLRPVEGAHQLARLVRALGHSATVEVDRQDDEALLGVAACDVADVVVEAPPLLDEHHAGALALAAEDLSDALLSGLRRELDAHGCLRG